MNRRQIIQDTTQKTVSVAVSPNNNRIFWTYERKRSIYSATLSGDSLQSFPILNGIAPMRIAINHRTRQIYWTDDIANRVSQSSFDGTNQRVLYQGIEGEYPFGIYYDDQTDQLYWTDYGLDLVRRMDLETGRIEDVVSEVKDPTAMAMTINPNSLLNYADRSGSITVSEAFQIYPNPAKETVNILLKDQEFSGPVRLKLINQFGQIMYQIEMEDAFLQIKTAHLKTGHYVFELHLEDQIYRKALVLIK